MSEKCTQEEYEEFLNYALKGNQDAIDFVKYINYILHTWDDVIDGDHRVSDKEMNSAFWMSLVELPRNSFYARHFAEFNTIMTMAIIDWQTANKFESEGDALALEIAFIIRSTYYNFLAHSVLIVGGYEWALEIAPKARRLCHGEGLAGYMGNLRKEKQTREDRKKEIHHGML